MTIDILTAVVKTATVAVELKRLMLKRKLHQDVLRQLYLEQFAATTKGLEKALAPVVEAQVDDYVQGLRSGTKQFCPTGPGGGIDPTCSPGGASSGKFISESDVSAWLADSVNKEITYHATSAASKNAIESDGVDVTKSRAGGLIFGQGFYTSNSEKDALSQANDPGAAIVRVAIRMKNPVDLINDPSKWGLLSKIETTGFNAESQEKIRKSLIEMGYDGIIMPGSGGARVVVGITNESVRVVRSQKSFSDIKAASQSHTDWTQEFKRAAFPVLADAMMKAATAQFLQLGVDIRKRGGKKAFCPTGPGGGVDPTCSPGGGKQNPNLQKAIAAFGPVLAEGVQDGYRFRIHDSHPGSNGNPVHILDDPETRSVGHAGIATIESPKGSIVKAQFWMDWAEPHYPANYKELSKAERAGLEVEEQKKYGYKKMYQSRLATAREYGDVLKEPEFFKQFCPTGPGGGVDPTCGSGGGASTRLTVNERNALEDYTTDKFQTINAALRSGKPLSGENARIVKNVDSALAKMEKRPGATIRSFDIPTGEAGDAIRKSLAEGGLYSDAAYLSTRTNPSASDRIGWASKVLPANRVILRVEGKNGVNISSISKNPGETEVLYPRGTKFNVVRAQHFPNGSILAILSEAAESKSVTKSTATDWLDRNELILPSDFVSDMPRWMQDNIAKQLKESFDQDYWEGMAQTTQDDIETVLRTMSEGESISSMAKTIKEKLGTEYYHNRARNIARTEAANALNGARWSVYDDLMREVGPQVPMKMQWLSVLGTTTRDTHAHLDGVPADKDGLWYLGGKRIPWPGHYSLPPGERCNCQCTISIAFGMSEDDAIPLIQDYYRRRDDMELGGQRGGIEDLWVKQFCPTGPGGGVDPSCGSGGGSSRSDLISEVVAATQSDRIERSFLVYPGGRTSEIVKGTGEGDDATVDHFKDPKTQIAGSNIEAVHTHPISQQEANEAGHKYTGLSTGDLANIHSNPGISKITAVDLDGTEFSLSRLRHDPDSLRDLWKRQREVLSDVHQRHLDQYIDGKITRDELKVRARSEAREVIAVLEEEGFVSYTETRRSAKAFCPTGPGGGVDPTCSPGKASSAPAPTIVLEDSQITKVKPLSGGSNAPTYIEYTDGAGQTQKGMFKADGDEASSPYYQAFPRGSQAAREVTASLIGKELGLGDAVASTQFAEVGGRRGVLQNWINDTAQVGYEYIDANFKGDRYSGDSAVIGKQMSKILEKVDGIEDMQYFDLLTGNADRHEGNWMVKGGKVAMIDNGATFASNEHYIAEGTGMRRQPRLRTLESSPAHSTGMQPMSSKFAEGVQNLLKNRDAISEQMAANGLKSKEIDSFWKRAEFLSKTRVFGFSQDTLMEFARLSEGIKNPWD